MAVVLLELRLPTRKAALKIRRRKTKTKDIPFDGETGGDGTAVSPRATLFVPAEGKRSWMTREKRMKDRDALDELKEKCVGSHFIGPAQKRMRKQIARGDERPRTCRTSGRRRWRTPINSCKKQAELDDEREKDK